MKIMRAMMLLATIPCVMRDVSAARDDSIPWEIDHADMQSPHDLGRVEGIEQYLRELVELGAPPGSIVVKVYGAQAPEGGSLFGVAINPSSLAEHIQDLGAELSPRAVEHLGIPDHRQMPGGNRRPLPAEYTPVGKKCYELAMQAAGIGYALEWVRHVLRPVLNSSLCHRHRLDWNNPLDPENLQFWLETEHQSVEADIKARFPPAHSLHRPGILELHMLPDCSSLLQTLIAITEQSRKRAAEAETSDNLERAQQFKRIAEQCAHEYNRLGAQEVEKLIQVKTKIHTLENEPDDGPRRANTTGRGRRPGVPAPHPRVIPGEKAVQREAETRILRNVTILNREGEKAGIPPIAVPGAEDNEADPNDPSNLPMTDPEENFLRSGTIADEQYSPAPEAHGQSAPGLPAPDLAELLATLSDDDELF